MALNNANRRAASRVVPLVTAGSQRYLHHSRSSAAVNQPPRELLRRQFPSLLHSYSKMSEAHESLINALEFEIKHTVESPGGKENAVPPEGFSFEIEDRSGQKTITLTREFEGETINIEVHMPSLRTGKEDDYDQSSIPLVVRVSKGNGPSLEFGCTAYPDKIAIDSLSIKDPENFDDQIAYEGPDFADLDWNVQKAVLLKYLKIRGITPKTTNFLHGYMLNKHTREYITWLKKFKWFVEA